MFTWTPEQKRLLDEIAAWPPSASPPTRKELGLKTGKTAAAISAMLERMERRGLVRLHRGWRGIELLQRPARQAA